MEAKRDFWSISGSFIYRHHVQERHRHYVLQESSFPITLKYIGVVRRTNTTLDVWQESLIKDYWNVHGDRQLSGPWTQFRQQGILTPLYGYLWSRRRFDTSRPVCRRNRSKKKNSFGQKKAEAQQCTKVDRIFSLRKTWNSVKP